MSVSQIWPSEDSLCLYVLGSPTLSGGLIHARFRWWPGVSLRCLPTHLRLPQVLPKLHFELRNQSIMVAGLGKLKATALWVDHSGLWAVEHDHGSWIMNHGSRVLGASATGTEKDRDGPSHAAGLDVLMVT